eukprot:2842296-Amphidinium_carterae.1
MFNRKDFWCNVEDKWDFYLRRAEIEQDAERYSASATRPKRKTRLSNRKRRAHRQGSAEPFCRHFAATLPDMDAQDAMKGEALMADMVKEMQGSRGTQSR